jgi:hypothetical protein
VSRFALLENSGDAPGRRSPNALVPDRRTDAMGCERIRMQWLAAAGRLIRPHAKASSPIIVDVFHNHTHRNVIFIVKELALKLCGDDLLDE